MAGITCKVLSLMAVLLMTSAYTFANGPDQFQSNRDIHVNSNENPSEVTCLGCSIYVRGEVGGDVTAIAGNIILENGAKVHGDTTSILGNIQLADNTRADRDVTAVGGAIRRQPQSEVGGDITALEGQGWLVAVFLIPLIFIGGMLALAVWLVLWLVRRSRPQMPVPA